MKQFNSIKDFLFRTGSFHLPSTLVFFDTETTGFPSKAKSFDDPSQARAVQVGLAVVDTATRTIRNILDTIIEVPSVPAQVAEIHGITSQISIDYGVTEMGAAYIVHDLCREHPLVAHNIEFDLSVMRCLYARCGISQHPFEEAASNDAICTMRGSKDYAKVPMTEKQRARGMTGYKDPNLQEAYKALVDPVGFENAHSAMADVHAAIAVFFATVDMIIEEMRPETEEEPS